MPNFLKTNAPAKGPDLRSESAKALGLAEGQPVQMNYASKDVTLPPDFLSLTSPPPDALPVTITPVDWASSELPQNVGLYAIVLDNVVSPSECAELIRLVESSVDVSRIYPRPVAGAGGESDPWIPAMVNAGGGFEVLHSEYRNSDRIVWDDRETVDRLWKRCMQGRPGEILRERLSVLNGDDNLGAWVRKGPKWKVHKQRWDFERMNERMRFLRYGPGQFFKPHCDSAFRQTVDGEELQTFFTFHLYLNDSVAEAGEGADLVGGATAFLSGDSKKKVDVNPKAGRVLIFQHRRLYHCGAEVIKGTKYTMRSDLLYKLVEPEKPEAEEASEKADKKATRKA